MPNLHRKASCSDLVPAQFMLGWTTIPSIGLRNAGKSDLRAMREAEFNVVRIAEFAWAFMEPREGEFDFDWLDRFLDLAQEHDIHVILGTPSAVMPAWLAARYPEAMAMKPDGTRVVWGGRRHNCFSNQDYRKLSERIARQMAERYAKHPAVIGWQIDNELGGTDCRCEDCRQGFQEWLREEYGSLENLHKAWGSRFWGLLFSEWSEITIPDDRIGEWAISNPSASLDWMRFTSHLNVDFLKAQAEIIRASMSCITTSSLITSWACITRWIIMLWPSHSTLCLGTITLT